jgi:hypothetical protein
MVLLSTITGVDSNFHVREKELDKHYTSVFVSDLGISISDRLIFVESF